MKVKISKTLLLSVIKLRIKQPLNNPAGKNINKDVKIDKDIDRMLSNLLDDIERKDTDEKLKTYALRLNVMLKNGFEENHAIKIIAQLMSRTQE